MDSAESAIQIIRDLRCRIDELELRLRMADRMADTIEEHSGPSHPLKAAVDQYRRALAQGLRGRDET